MFVYELPIRILNIKFRTAQDIDVHVEPIVPEKKNSDDALQYENFHHTKVTRYTVRHCENAQS